MSDNITGDLDLLGDWLDAKGYTEEAGLCTRAMDEINKLRAALKPFADAAEDLDEGEAGSLWERPAAMNITCDDLRNSQLILNSSSAAAALKETE